MALLCVRFVLTCVARVTFRNVFVNLTLVGLLRVGVIASLVSWRTEEVEGTAKMQQELMRGIHGLELVPPKSEPINIEVVMQEFRSNGRESSPVREMPEALSPILSVSSEATDSFHGGSLPLESWDFSVQEPNTLEGFLPCGITYQPGGSVGYVSLEANSGVFAMDDMPTGIHPLHNQCSHSKKKTVYCTFCMNNGECGSFYTSHSLHDCRGTVTCPILFRYQCPICGATGKTAHTRNYCPMNENRSRVPMMNKLRGMRSSTGQFRGVKNNSWK